MNDLDYLIETLETDPYELDPLPVSKDWERDMGISDAKLFRVKGDNTQYFGTFKKNGAYELHHENKGVSGVVLNNKTSNTSYNAKFIKTNMALVTNLLRDGHQVRIVAPSALHGNAKGLIDHYHKLVHRIVGKTANISDIEYSHNDDIIDTSGNKTNIEFKKFNISNKQINKNITESMKILNKLHNQPNLFILSTGHHTIQ